MFQTWPLRRRTKITARTATLLAITASRIIPPQNRQQQQRRRMTLRTPRMRKRIKRKPHQRRNQRRRTAGRRLPRRNQPRHQTRHRPMRSNRAAFVPASRAPRSRVRARPIAAWRRAVLSTSCVRATRPRSPERTGHARPPATRFAHTLPISRSLSPQASIALRRHARLLPQRLSNSTPA